MTLPLISKNIHAGIFKKKTSQNSMRTISSRFTTAIPQERPKTMQSVTIHTTFQCISSPIRFAYCKLTGFTVH